MQSDLFSGAGEALHRPASRLSQIDPDRWPVDGGWRDVVDGFWASEQGARLLAFLRDRLAAGAIVYPADPLRALALTPLSAVKVVIVGQDPYHGPGQAEGLAFSVAPGIKVPPSLRNMFKELVRSGCLAQRPEQGSLASWARRGVLLLNTSLTVEDGRAGSHAKRGWEGLTDALLFKVASEVPACVYLLWGGHAQSKSALIERALAQSHGQALILKANHPSPLSALRPPVPFEGCDHFLKTTQWWAQRGHAWDWSV